MQIDHLFRKRSASQFLPALLIGLFSYAAFSKLLDFRQFEAAMLVQPFPRTIAFILAFVIPPAELTAAALLAGKRTRYAGLWLSVVLMSQFTGYAALAYFHFRIATPCPCGGILGSMSWGPHLLFNIFFLLVTIVSIFITNRERRGGDPKSEC
jgi:hypothetical protein